MRLPVVPPDHHSIFGKIATNTDKLMRVIQQTAVDNKGRYLHWDDFRFRTPPDQLTTEEAWCGTRLARQRQMTKTSLNDKDGQAFSFVEPDRVRWLLHWIDGKATGNVIMPIPLNNQSMGKSFHVASLIEEAFSSSRLEGAATTRGVAKAMLREGRRPQNKSEKMIWNNYQAMEFIGRHKHETLTVDMILELHRIVTEDTLDQPEMAGVLRRMSDSVVVEDADGNVLHTPPVAKLLLKRLEQICIFANSPSFGADGRAFIHPVIQAIILHFMIGYDHPFVDGNGRTARALFYWHMVKNGYWLAEYLSISRIIMKAPTQYGRAYLETETDRGDLTYFILHQLETVKRSIGDLIAHLQAKAQELVELESQLLSPGHEQDFNYRQLEVLKQSIERPGMIISINEHQRANRVTYQTARKDLLDLSGAGMLDQRKIGKKFIFVAPANLRSRIDAHQKKSKGRKR